jgi:hypothetical protein
LPVDGSDFGNVLRESQQTLEGFHVVNRPIAIRRIGRDAIAPHLDFGSQGQLAGQTGNTIENIGVDDLAGVRLRCGSYRQIESPSPLFLDHRILKIH